LRGDRGRGEESGPADLGIYAGLEYRTNCQVLQEEGVESRDNGGVKIMHEFHISWFMDFESIKKAAESYDRLVYAFNTCWWKLGDPVYSYENGLPCGPRGEVLLETDDPMGFIETAERNPGHYGRHGLKAFAAAYHGNVRTRDGRPTSFDSWDKYNDLIDEEDTRGK